jgi:hypothetical protein
MKENSSKHSRDPTPLNMQFERTRGCLENWCQYVTHIYDYVVPQTYTQMLRESADIFLDQYVWVKGRVAGERRGWLGKGVA